MQTIVSTGIEKNVLDSIVETLKMTAIELSTSLCTEIQHRNWSTGDLQLQQSFDSSLGLQEEFAIDPSLQDVFQSNAPFDKHDEDERLWDSFDPKKHHSFSETLEKAVQAFQVFLGDCTEPSDRNVARDVASGDTANKVASKEVVADTASKVASKNVVASKEVVADTASKNVVTSKEGIASKDAASKNVVAFNDTASKDAASKDAASKDAASKEATGHVRRMSKPCKVFKTGIKLQNVEEAMHKCMQDSSIRKISFASFQRMTQLCFDVSMETVSMETVSNEMVSTVFIQNPQNPNIQINNMTMHNMVLPVHWFVNSNIDSQGYLHLPQLVYLFTLLTQEQKIEKKGFKKRMWLTGVHGRVLNSDTSFVEISVGNEDCLREKRNIIAEHAMRLTFWVLDSFVTVTMFKNGKLMFQKIRSFKQAMMVGLALSLFLSIPWIEYEMREQVLRGNLTLQQSDFPSELASTPLSKDQIKAFPVLALFLQRCRPDDFLRCKNIFANFDQPWGISQSSTFDCVTGKFIFTDLEMLIQCLRSNRHLVEMIDNVQYGANSSFVSVYFLRQHFTSETSAKCKKTVGFCGFYKSGYCCITGFKTYESLNKVAAWIEAVLDALQTFSCNSFVPMEDLKDKSVKMVRFHD